ncbi:astacin [Teladorsagia circumcincta]|uniref:Metalloendopeptidase n=1 Tax=Teladorsagia circumcincta TaxID=45464 RepID=A0A2G9UDR9_TELCI|nr:astacin [Teladorsagia circumcincta]
MDAASETHSMSTVGLCLFVAAGLGPAGPRLAAAQYSNIYQQIEPYIHPYFVARPHHDWINSGKFQGDIAGIDAALLQEPDGMVFYNALKNKQLAWKDGIIPYEMDPAFCKCYSQVGRTGGKQEISLGRGCLFHEIIVHELMHSVGFWHEHSRADRDDHIHIRWDNILPGMKSQFDKISAALQDTQGEKYDYRSIMHYDSTAFSRNGKNTIETVVDGFTDVIGSSVDLSELDIVKAELPVRRNVHINWNQDKK